MSDAQNKSIADFNTDDEVQKYSYYDAVRGMGVEPFPTMADDLSSLPTNEVDDYFLKLAEQSREARGAFTEAGKSAVAGVRQPLQEGINTVTDWFGTQLKEFYTVNGFASPEQVENIIPESMLAYANEKGINTELPLKHVQPDTQLGITGRELIAYTTGFLLSMGKGARKEATDTVLDGIGRYSHNLLRAARGNTGGAMSLNVAEANLSDLAVELGFDEELRNYFSDGSIADRVATAVADETNIRANPKLDDASLASLSAEGRLARKLDTVLEENYIGAALGTAILTAAKAFKIAGAKGSAAIGAGAVVATPTDAESNPLAKAGAKIAGATAKNFDTDYLGFYSKALEVAKELPQNKATGEQYLRMLSKAGVTDDELYWTGLQEFATDLRKMDKEQLVNFLERNRVNLEEVELRSADENPTEIEYREEIVDGGDEINYQVENIRMSPADYADDFEYYLQSTQPVRDDDIATVMDNFKGAINETTGELETQYLEPDVDNLFDEFAYYRASREYEDEPITRYYADREPNQTPVNYEILGQYGDYTVIDTTNGQGIETYSTLADAQAKLETLALDDGAINLYPTQYERWTQPGGSNYREHLIRLDNYRGDPSVTDAYAAFTPDMRPKAQEYEQRQARGERLSDEEKREKKEIDARAQMLLLRREGDLGSFTASHFDEYDDNIVAHYRTKERRTSDGKRILYVEEIQSDWAGEGRKREFMQSTAESDEARIAEIVDGELEYAKIKQRYNDFNNLLSLDLLGDLPESRKDYWREYFPSLADVNFANEGERLNTLKELLRDMRDETKEYWEQATEKAGGKSSLYNAKKEVRVPRAPFVYNIQTGKENTGAWTRLVLKRILMQAAQEGYDGIAIASGRANADHYNLRKYFDWIDINRDIEPNPVDGKPTYSMTVKPKDSGGSYTQEMTRIHEDELPSIIGQRQAVKAIEALAKKKSTDASEPMRLAGSDLASGGEGMLNFYDKIVPASMSKVLSKIDKNAKPQQVGVRKSGDKTGGQRSDLDLGIIFTDELKEKLKKGVPLFMPPALAVGVGAMAEKANQQTNTAQMEMNF
jgi:hypothetical protein